MRRFLLAVFCFAFVPAFAFAGTQSYTTPGTYTFTIPAYATLTVQVWGGGGGGGSGWGESVANGGNGAASSFSGVTGNGGAGSPYDFRGGPGGAGGSASGGTTNTTGGTGGTGGGGIFGANGGNGGSSPSGGAGGVGYEAGFDATPSGHPAASGSAPGGGGGGGYASGGGGGGGYSTKTYSSGALSGNVTVIVGGGGAGAGSVYAGASGAPGRVSITWTDAVPTCSVTADVNPLEYGSSTMLRWTSANATSFHIANVGYVTANQSGSTSVGPLATTAYNGTAVGSTGTTTCSFSLAVSAPTSCTFNGETVNHGSSVTAYQAATVPYGSSCVSQSRTCSNGTLSGSYEYSSCNRNCSFNDSPVAHGSSVTAYQSSVAPEGQSCASISQSRSCSDGTLSGSYEYASCSLSCTPSYSCTGEGNQTITYTDASCQESTVATCSLPEFCTAGSATCLYNAVVGNITASPRLVASGKSSTISWSVENAQSCTVTGNGNTWTGTSGSHTSNPITQYTVYTLVCDDTDADSVQDDFTDTVRLVRVPSWVEI